MKKYLYRICCLSLMFFLILSSVFITVNENGFYSRQYAKNDTERYTGVSYEDLDSITALLLDYLNGKTDSLDMQCEKFGKNRRGF